MRIVIRPMSAPVHEIDLTDRLVAAIAHAIWCHTGGNDLVNWLEAEQHLAQLVGAGNAGAVPASGEHGSVVPAAIPACPSCPRAKRPRRAVPLSPEPSASQPRGSPSAISLAG